MDKSQLIALVALFVSVNNYGHSGGTDENGSHNCSAVFIEKGLCTRYHYHNGSENLDIREDIVEVDAPSDENYFYYVDSDDRASK